MVYWLVQVFGMGLATGGLYISLKNRALSGPSIDSESREARRHGQIIGSVGFLVLLVGCLLPH